MLYVTCVYVALYLCLFMSLSPIVNVNLFKEHRLKDKSGDVNVLMPH
jgi:hypothetical protein